MVDLFASGDVPGDRAASLLDDAGAFARSMGSHEMQDVRATGFAGGAKNAARDLRRKLMKGSKWPSVYEAHIRFWSVKQQLEVTRKVALLLPHEIIGAMADIGSPETLCQSMALDPTNQRKHESIEEKLQSPFVSVSLWGDGVPFSWDRKKSADMWTISFPGLQEKKMRDLRIPITSMPHEFVCRSTQDDLMEILSWSFKALALGSYPTSRHDQTDFVQGDTWRKKRAGAPLLHGALLEVKGDWKQMHCCFAIPGWMRAGHRPICWRCTASKDSLKRESGRGSSWMLPENRLTDFEGLERISQEGEHLSPLFSCPWMSLSSLRIDWLHVADQGISAVYLGGLFHMLLSDRALGANEDARCRVLWEEIQAFYLQHQTADRLFNLTKTMVKPRKGSIELAGSGAQIRALIPFGLQVVEAWPAEVSAEKYAARACMRHLAECYSFLATALQARDDTLLDHALAFHTTLRTLHDVSAKRWQLRPKLHMFMELCFEGGSPSCSWNYREESFGGSVSRQSHRYGGVATPLAMSKGTLDKFCIKESLPRLH